MSFLRAVESAGAALRLLGEPFAAGAVLDAANGLRLAGDLPRSPGDRALIERWAGRSLADAPAGPLRLQSLATLANWVGDLLDGALVGEARAKERHRGVTEREGTERER